MDKILLELEVPRLKVDLDDVRETPKELELAFEGVADELDASVTIEVLLVGEVPGLEVLD